MNIQVWVENRDTNLKTVPKECVLVERTRDALPEVWWTCTSKLEFVIKSMDPVMSMKRPGSYHLSWDHCSRSLYVHVHDCDLGKLLAIIITWLRPIISLGWCTVSVVYLSLQYLYMLARCDDLDCLQRYLDRLFRAKLLLKYIYSEDVVEEYPFTGIVLYDMRICIEFI